MRILRGRADLQSWREQQGRLGRPIHAVPTMGALHEGHLSLIAAAGRDASDPPAAVLLTIFVNPLQFGPGEDLGRYPRTPDRDLDLARAAGVDAVFLPTPAEVFPHGIADTTRIVPPPALGLPLCGRNRPGHFEGVATVVTRLIALAGPELIVLGEKDWQQLVILRRVVRDLGLPVRLRSCGTVRDLDGLALSSRNRYLDDDQRRRAARLPKLLRAWSHSSAALDPHGSDRLDDLRDALESCGLRVEYLELVHPFRLAAASDPADSSPASGMRLLAAAVHCGPARLIDHVFLMPRAPIVAIDGPAGAGKSTVTRALARRLGLLYLDTGAMYRAVTWMALESGADPDAESALEPLLQALDLQLDLAADGGQSVSVAGRDVSEAIRSPQVTGHVSRVAAHPCVRRALTDQQRRMGRRGGLVAEGRDIGTAVFPDADVKIFLTASVGERARRRAGDLRQRGFPVPALEDLEEQIAERDHRDSARSVAPLRRADDAIDVCTDGLSVEEVIERLVDVVRERIPEDAWPSSDPSR
jgi:pantoate ligase/cytidylate kinase